MKTYYATIGTGYCVGSNSRTEHLSINEAEALRSGTRKRRCHECGKLVGASRITYDRRYNGWPYARLAPHKPPVVQS
jgi:hypothetical protein